MEDFNKPKIVWGEISDKTKFCIDADGDFVNEATTFLLVGEHLSYLLAMLNSSLSEYLFSNIGTTTGVGTTRWKKFKIIELPVMKYCGLQIQKELEDIALNRVTDSLENEINHKVYELYGLSTDEIRFVESM